eukprot:gnl/TRDRNA2_/TRDRNA2_44938_c0_seq1.p1 gnl/TRDRNA2_/TRDRNA2_44938_c0~~gnl/TRDRNA2_/TRDRNA2_44938_c0_seq1.p1  ORF type:complete len:385 (-),score=40.29 gnl/TRDRNA2_/TRDRNA2_44938_c0_seq1:276-1406(-)
MDAFPCAPQSLDAAPVTKLSRRAKRRARQELETKNMGMQEIVAASDASTRASSPSGASSISSFSHRTVTTSDLGLDIVTPVSSPERTVQSLPSPILWKTHGALSTPSAANSAQFGGLATGIASQRKPFVAPTATSTSGSWSFAAFESSSLSPNIENGTVQSACFTMHANVSVDPATGDASRRTPPLAPLAGSQSSGAWAIMTGTSPMSASHATCGPRVGGTSQRSLSGSPMTYERSDGEPVVVASYPVAGSCTVPNTFVCDASQRSPVGSMVNCIVGTSPVAPAGTVGGSAMGDASERSPAWNTGATRGCLSAGVSAVSADGAVSCETTKWSPTVSPVVSQSDVLKSWLCGASGPVPSGNELAEQLRAAAPEVYDD